MSGHHNEALLEGSIQHQPSSGWKKVAFGFIFLSLALIGGSVFFVLKYFDHKNENSSPTNGPDSAAVLKALGEKMTAYGDLTADPCEDFYTYACGGWMNSTKLPASSGRYDLSFNTVTEENNKLQFSILAEDWPLLGTFYSACMNMDARNDLGTKPLASIFKAIDDATANPGSRNQTAQKLAGIGARLWTSGISVFFEFDITTANPTQPDDYLPSLAQGGMALPAPSMYTKNDTSSKKVISEYVSHVQQMLSLATGANTTTALAQAVVDFETKLAKASLAPADQTPKGTDNPTSIADVRKMLGDSFDIDAFLSKAQLSIASFNVMEPGFFKALPKTLDGTKAETVNAYLKWQVAHQSAKLLTADIQTANFNFFGKVLAGSSAPSPANETCLNSVNTYLPFLLSRYFVQQAFSPETRTEAQTLLTYVLDAFKANLEVVPWMDNSTRQVAVGKLEAMTKRIGYPDVWPSYDGVELAENDLLSNALALNDHTLTINRDRLKTGKVDKNVWYMYPAMVNAYYDPTTNSINFPAGILQVPFYNATRPASVNFGQIGAVMGHEMTHGFDNNGAQYDKDGALKDWWPEKVVKAFENKTQCVVDQYDTYTLKGLPINGRQTLGENIADIGAVKNAFGAHRQFIRDNKNRFSASDIEGAFQGLNPDQVFFLAYAQNWCEISTKAFLESDLQTNPHSPGPIRVLGPLTDFPGFAETFQCKTGAKYNPPNKDLPNGRCEVW